jgi:Holliday junction resolvasome RuvABC endonuclease subunit
MHLAVDLGLRTTGLAGAGWSKAVSSPNGVHKSPVTDEVRNNRFYWWFDMLTSEVKAANPTLIVVEAPFMHPKHPKGAMDLLMLHGILRSVCYTRMLPVYEVPNTRLKKWVTGDARASKDDMVLAAAYMSQREICDHNEADAALLHYYWEELGDAQRGS